MGFFVGMREDNLIVIVYRWWGIIICLVDWLIDWDYKCS